MLRYTILIFIALAAGTLSLLALTDAPDAVLADGGRYYGPLVDDRLHGRGKLEWANGAVYTGGFTDGLMSGEGRMEFADGDIYEGEFHQGLMHGQGRLENPRGHVYQGTFDKDQLVEGTYTGDLGTRYEGEFKHWMFHGRGRLETEYGEVREGRFELGEHVAGTYIESDGWTYEGEFVKGWLQGQGRSVDPEGNVYIGDFHDGTPHGTGRMEYANGDVYEGEFEYGWRHGEGELIPAGDGEVRRGTWVYDSLEADGEADNGARGVETVLYNQSELLASALEALEPGDPETIDLYLLAVAGDGSQEVFRREVEFANALFARRFGTRGRSVMLVNSRTSFEDIPLATNTSFERALSTLDERMNDDDILFVYLTSHGTRDHRLVLDQNMMHLPDLQAARMGEMLEASGIRWKVVVVSACYAGGFIEPLDDSNTLVITAAAADRQSFGCSDTAEFTYFGRAYLHDALAETGDFHAAFDHAATLIEEREAEEGMSPHSAPQIHAPEPALTHLARWRSQREVTQGRAEPAPDTGE